MVEGTRAPRSRNSPLGYPWMVERARAVGPFAIVQILSDIHGRGCESTTYKSFQLSMVVRARAPRSRTRISMVEGARAPRP
eukprot:12893605-Prorocentrum_lima.AAC.1